MSGHMAVIFQEQFSCDNTELKMIFFGAESYGIMSSSDSVKGRYGTRTLDKQQNEQCSSCARVSKHY